jgi:hypothetical protein
MSYTIKTLFGTLSKNFVLTEDNGVEHKVFPYQYVRNSIDEDDLPTGAMVNIEVYPTFNAGIAVVLFKDLEWE